MADNLKKTFTIEIAGVKESVTNLETLEGVLDKMEKQVESINKNGGFSVISKQAKQSSKEAVDIAKAEEVAQNKVATSYREKQRALTAIGKEIKTMVAADGESVKRQQELIGEYNQLNESLKRFDASMGNHQRNVGDYGQATKNLKQELREMQEEMANMIANGIDKADPKFVALAQKAGAMKDAMGDAREEVDRFASDTKKLDDVINVAQSATAAFTLYKGAMSAFGIETKGAEEAMQQLMGAMSIIQSLKQLQESLNQNSATAKIYHKALQMLGLEAKKTAVAETELAASQTTVNTVQKTGTAVTRGLSAAMKTIPLLLIIGLVTELVMHWEEIVGWFTKTFPVLKKLSGWFNKLSGFISGVSEAVWAAIKSFGSLGEVIKAIFSGEWGKAVEIAKNNFRNMTNAFKKGYADRMAEIQEGVTAKQAAEDDKILTHKKNMITKQKNADGTYRKEYIEANKKMFDNRKKMYKKDSDEYRKVLEEEAAFHQQVEDAKESAAKKSASERAAANKKAAKDAADAEKKAAEEAKKAAEYRAKAEEALYRSTAEYLIKQKEDEIKYYEAEVKLYSAGPVDKYQEAVKKVNKATGELVTLQRQLKLYDFFNDYKQNIDESATSLNDFMANMNVLVGQFKVFNDKVTVEEFGVVAKQLSMFSNLTEDQLKYLYHIYIDYLKDGLTKVNETNADIRAVQEEQLKKEQEDIEKTTLKFELENDKKSENAINLVKTLNNQWDNYLEHVKQVYGEDSKEYLEAQKKKRNDSVVGDKKTDNRRKSPINKEEYTKNENGTTNWKALWDDGQSFVDNLLGNFQLLDEMVLAPAMDTFSMYMDFAIEETAQKLEQVQEMHDKALDKVEESAEKIKELNDSLKDSANTNLESTKQQLADEQLLYAQRLAEEKKLAEEERALKNKQAKQEANARKMELRYQMIMGIANTAQGASKALADWGWPLGAVFAGIMAALGAIQVALIAKQIASIQPVKYAEGGLLSGPSHSQGGIPVGNTGIEVEGKEYIVNKRSTAKYLPLLEAINAEGRRNSFARTDKRLRKYADGGQINFDRADENLRTNADTNRLIGAIEKIDMQPVVSVKDFWRAEDRLVKVRSLAGKQ